MYSTISVAMTTYNGESFVEKQLNSLLNQNRKPDEVIIVDDCSKDNTVNIIEDFIKKYNLHNWKLIKLKKNGGFIESFKKSICETKGDIVFLCDQDDIWLNNKIEIMFNTMKSNKNIICLASAFEKINSQDKRIKTKNNILSTNHNLIRKKIKKGDCVNISSQMVSTYNISPGCTCAFKGEIRNILIKMDNEVVPLVHDWKINFISSLMEGLYFLNISTTLYRLHDSNTLGLSREMGIDKRISLCQKGYLERNYMKEIVNRLISLNIIDNNFRNKEIYNYIFNLEKSLQERKEALVNRKILHSIFIIVKYGLVSNRMYESVIIDIITILKSYSRKEHKNAY